MKLQWLLLIFVICETCWQHFDCFFFVVGQLMSATYYTITPETMERKLLSEELIGEVLQHANDPDGNYWNFTYDDVQIEILKREKHKVEFIASRDIPEFPIKFESTRIIGKSIIILGYLNRNKCIFI